MGDKKMEGDEEGEMQMDEHHGFKVVQEASETRISAGRVFRFDEPAIIEFTVPDDKVGTWEIACFEDDGDHYDEGHKAKLVVTE